MVVVGMTEAGEKLALDASMLASEGKTVRGSKLDEELVGYIHRHTNGLVGQVTQLLSMAVEKAILNGTERITLPLLKEIAFTPVTTSLSGKKKETYKI